ncbi:hypothetical protein DNTS_012372 [Danionella cerebrum]|uniref:RING-type E3 ubiquitin transferase n=1 Tax=Danionella cerebrum TaxID=2873325 RepID=A0A553RA83_9TELE|nr:hypothetical protein DNTS_012372 [Danionella translucida]
MAESLSSALKQKEKKRSSKDVPPIMSLTEELQCSVCLDVFTDPVSIPCGHSFCQSCLKRFWDVSENCFCPFCKEPFHQRPELKINRALREVIQLFVKKPGLNTSNVPCDVCDKRKQEALKSCLVCQISFCETHLEPHLRVPGLKKHKLINAVEKIADYICQEHERVLELYCREDQMFLCQTCSLTDHKNHKTVSLEEENGLKKTKVIKLQTDVQKMIEDRMKKVLDIKHAADHRKQNMEEEKAESLEIFSALIRSNELFQVEHLEMMEQKQRAAEKQEEELIGDLEREISELKRRNAELEKLSHSEDQFQLIRIFPSLHKPFNFRTSSEISSDTRLTVGTLRRALDPLLETLQEKEKLLVETELKKMKLFAVDVTLDPETAHPKLILSPDGKQVSHGGVKQNVPENPKRFVECVSVLGKDGFCLGRFYFEVQVKDKTNWDLGVARESVERKGDITLTPQNGIWSISLRNRNEYKACADPSVRLSPKAQLQRVGVLVDYEEGLVSFYDIESKSHIYSFTEQTFTEKLYPYFSPCLHGDGNSAPLIITAVKHKTHWDLGVARESVQRKGDIKPTPQNGIWSIWLRNGNEFEALEDPSVRLFLKTQLQRVGVLVDYEEGLVSFYEVESKSHIYSFTGQTFTEKLYTSVQA